MTTAAAETRYLGIDIGSSVTKAALFDAGGTVLSVASRPTRLIHGDGGHVEQDVEDVLRSVAAVVSDIGVPDPALVAITGQGDGCWLVDEDGVAVRPAVSWMDGRAAALVAEWERDGTVEAVYRATGNTLFPGSQAAILHWLEEHEPSTVDRAATAAYCKDVVLQRLTGLRATDPSDASLPFGDPHGDGYSATALKLCGLDHRANLLAPVHRLPSAELSGAGSALIGLPPGTPVFSGPFDLTACPAGAGVAEPGDGLLIVGTTLACEVLVDGVDLAGPVSGMHLATARPDRWVRVLPAMVGSASLDWVLDLLGMRHDDVARAIERTRPGAGGVEMLPYLAPSGERAPFLDPTARGQLTGLNLTTTREDLVRAVCEGIAFAARDCFEHTTLSGRLWACGGGVRCRPWLQIFADVLGRPIHIPQTPEVGTRGAVLGALAAQGDPVDPADWTSVAEVIEPTAEASHYDDGFARYLSHRAAARPLWRTT